MRQTEFLEKLLPMKDMIFRFAMSILSNRTEAEDITQDIYERLWLRRDRLEDCTNLKGFVMTSTRNICLDKIRSAKVHNNKIMDLGHTHSNRTEATGIENFDVREIVDAIVSTLPEKQQTIIHLRDVEGCDMDTICEIMKMESATARVNLSRARRYIKEELTKTMNYGI